MAKPIITNKEIKAVTNVLKSGMLAQGSTVEHFEKLFADYIGTDYAVAVNSGTAALHSCFNALGKQDTPLGKTDVVLTSPFTFAASVNSILMAGLRVEFVDIDEKTFNIDTTDVLDLPNYLAIMPIHLFGQACDMDKIMKLADDFNLHVIEDCAQAHGAKWGKKKVGTFGMAGAFSCYSTKNMQCAEGGIVTTDDESVANSVRSFRHHGQSSTYEYTKLGYNYRMTNISAAIAIEQLKMLDKRNEIRRKNSEFYDKKLKNISGITTPYQDKKAYHVFHQYSILVDEKQFGMTRDRLMTKLKEMGVGCGVFYPVPMHLQPYHQKVIGGKFGDFPVAERVASQILSLPIHPLVTKENIEYIVEVIRD